MLEQLRNMLLVTTPSQPRPTAQFLNAEVCLLLNRNVDVTIPLTALVRDYMHTILDARVHLTSIKETHLKFVEDLKAYGGLSKGDTKALNPYAISHHTAPIDYNIHGTPLTLLKLAAEQYVIARARDALLPLRDEIFDEITAQIFVSNFRGEMTKTNMRYEWMRVPKEVVDENTAVSMVTDVYLPSQMLAHRFRFDIDYHGKIERFTSDDGYEAAFSNNCGWLPQY